MGNVEYIAEPVSDDARWDHPRAEHLNGVPWFEAPIPRRLHRCKVQTKGWIGFTLVQRCACGGIKRAHDRFWMERNTAKESHRESIFDTLYNERKKAEIDRLNNMAQELYRLANPEE